METEQKKSHFTPIKFLVLLTFLVMLLSTILSILNLQTTNTAIIAEVGEIEKSVITVNSMFSMDGLRYIISNALANFIGFAPLATLLVAFFGVGVLEESGFINTFFTLLGKRISKRLLTFLVSIVCILATISIDSAYAFLIPLSAFFFLLNGRNPITGITTAFVSIAMGYGINFVFSIYGPTLNSISTVAASLIDNTYILNIWGSVIFLFVATILLAIVITEVTERIVVAKIGRSEIETKEITIGKKEYRGLLLGALAVLLMILVVIYGMYPGKIPGAGFLLDTSKYNYVHKLFGSTSPFNRGLPVIISFLMIVLAYVYGFGAKTLKRNPRMLEKSVKDVGYGIVLLFFAAQFIAIFKQSNIGIFLVNFLVDSIQNVQFTGIPLILLLFLVTMVSNFVVTSPFTKWSIMAPIVVPMFMKAGMTPEFTQIIFRCASSTTAVLTPLLAYFVAYIIYLQKYSKEEVTVGKIYSLVLPYSLFVSLTWIIVILGWYIIGIPVGIDILPILK